MNVLKCEPALGHTGRTIKRWMTGFSLFAAIMLLNLPTIAQAQALCVPFGFGGAYGPGPPAWFLPAGNGFARFNTWVDDPRWSGAASVTHGDGANHDVQFRALYSPQSAPGQFIYLSWWQKFALNTTTVNNRLYVGLSNGTATPALLLRITFASTTPTAASGSAASATVHVVDVNGNVGAAIPTPTWVNDMRVWIDQVTDQTTMNPAEANNAVEANNWAVHLRIPVGVNLGDAANTLTLGSSFNLWYELLQGTPATPIVVYTWPFSTSAQSFFVTTPGGIEKLPALSNWPQALLGENENNTACNGVTLDSGDIYVNNTAHGDGSIISRSESNTFHAKPHNKTGGPVPIGNIQARFRIANWGVQPSSTDADPASGNWNTVGKRIRDPADPNDDERGLDIVVQPGAGDILDNQQWDISGAWQPDSTAVEEAGFFNNTKSPHQCIQVELSSGAGVQFLRSSAFTNMRQVAASVFKETAEVSVVGLPTTTEGKRPVYLSVKRFNMPAEVASDAPKPGPIEVPPAPDREKIARAKSEGNEDQLAEQERFAEFTQYERRFLSEPSYVVRGYYDTGQRMRLQNEDRPILLPMVAFGYFVNHEGSLTGWKDNLTGLERIAPDFYQVKVPDNAAVKIGVQLEALEGHWPWWYWLILVLILILILFFILRRRSGTP